MWSRDVKMDDDSKGMNNNPSITSSSQSILCEDYRVYKWRWFILFVICILNFSNAMIWITFSPIADSTIVFFKIDSLRLNMLSLVYLIASIPFGFIASWLLDTLGLRTSIIMSAWLNAVGSVLRNISTIDSMPQSASYPVLLTGQILAACAQPFAMFAPTKVAALWFPGTQRATANMLASMANPLGILAANVIAPAVVSTPGDLPLALWVMTGPAVVTVLLATFGICSSVPPTPPTSSAAEESEPFFKGLKQIIRNKNYWVLNFCFGTGLAIFTALSSFFDQILCPRGYSDTFAGICGAIMIAAGAFGAVIAGLYVDRSKKFEEVVKVCFACAVLFGIMFTEVSRFRDQHVLIALSAALFGGFGFAIYPISMELAVEVTYPVAEATSAGLAIISGQFQGVIYMFLMQFIAQPLPDNEKNLPTGCATDNASANGFTPQDWTVPNLVLNGIGTFSVVLLLLGFKATYKRLLSEQKAKADKIMNISSEIVFSGSGISPTAL